MRLLSKFKSASVKELAVKLGCRTLGRLSSCLLSGFGCLLISLSSVALAENPAESSLLDETQRAQLQQAIFQSESASRKVESGGQDVTAVVAESSPTADLVKISTPNYVSKASNFRPKLGVSTYEAAWQGIPAAEMSVEVDTDGLHYFVNVSAKTYSAIDIFYRLRYQANGVLNAQDLLPIKSTFDQKENSRVKLTEITYLDSGEVRSYRRREDKEPEIMQFDPNNIMLDPFSAAFLSRSLDWTLGEIKKFDVFNGKSRYLITMTAVERTQLEVNGVLRNVLVISPTVDNLTSRKANKKLREARIYISDDANRDLLKIASSVFVGEVTATLTSFVESPTAYGFTVAKNSVANNQTTKSEENSLLK